jgi:hypothetical protein
MGLSELVATLRREANFRFARQPPTIVTWAELDFYDVPLICPTSFVNSAAFFVNNRVVNRCAFQALRAGHQEDSPVGKPAKYEDQS